MCASSAQHIKTAISRRLLRRSSTKLSLILSFPLQLPIYLQKSFTQHRHQRSMPIVCVQVAKHEEYCRLRQQLAACSCNTACRTCLYGDLFLQGIWMAMLGSLCLHGATGHVKPLVSNKLLAMDSSPAPSGFSAPAGMTCNPALCSAILWLLHSVLLRPLSRCQRCQVVEACLLRGIHSALCITVSIHITTLRACCARYCGW